MSVRPYRDIQRRKSRQIRVGSVLVGGDAPISVQTMTNTLTADAAATIKQIQEVEVIENFGVVERAFDHRFGTRLAVLLEQFLFQ